MFGMTESIAKKLTLLNMLASITALLCASTAFFAYDWSYARSSLLNRVNVQAEIIGYNCITPLVFNDPQSAQRTLAALRASQHIVYAGVYSPSGKFFAAYWRNANGPKRPFPLVSPAKIRNRWPFDNQYAVVQPIFLENKLVGSVYIRSDVGELVARLDGYLIILGATFIVSLGVALLVARTARQAISDPIIRLAEAARLVSHDKNFAVRAEPTGSRGEIAVLINSFNSMLSEIQKRDSALQESEAQFRTMADSVPQLAWIAEKDGRLSWYNQRWYDYTGTTEQEMLGWGWESVQDPKVLPNVVTNWKAAIATGKRFEMVFPLRAKNGSYREFLTLAVPLRDSHGDAVRWFGTNTDITAQRRAEDALRESEKLAATGRLAASIAHEINNPLEALANLLFLARRQPAKSMSYLITAEQELDRIAEITRHTLGFYRDTSTPVKLSLAEVGSGVLALYDRKLRFKKISVTKRFSRDTEISSFPGEIRQIFANLVANAIDAMPVEGRLTIKIAPSCEWSPARRSGVRFTILDNGPGIAPEHLQKIFEPFYTTKKDVGTGLGLWLTQNLVRKHSGTIRVRSVISPVRSGTAFSIFFPRDMIHDNHPLPPPSREAEEEPNVSS
ncbi:MAG: ATP-binding protein [Candidatus Acidiferrales bacterium]